MTQNTLYDAFDAAALSRSTDPVTSREAAENYVASGGVGSDEEAIMRVVRMFPGCTAGEIAHHLGDGWDNVRVTRRSGGLVAKGLVKPFHKTLVRKCRVKNRVMQTWEVMQ